MAGDWFRQPRLDDRQAGYCYTCGRRLIRDPEPRGYNTGSGDPIWTYSCPQIRWWRGGHTEKVMGLV